METNSRQLSNLANKTFNEALVDGFKLFAKIYKKLILPLALFQILLIVLDTLILTDLQWYIESFGLNVADMLDNIVDTPLTESEMNALASFLLLNFALLFLQNLIGAMIITIAMCTVSNYAFKSYMGEEVSFKDSFKGSFNKKIFTVIIILGFILPLSSLLLFIPGIIIFGFFIFLIFTYNMEDVNPIKEAKRIAKGSFFKVIGVFIINFIFIFVISFTFTSILDFFLETDSLYFQAEINSWFDPATRNYGMLILYQILYSLVDILFAPLFICLLTTIYSTLKARKELGYSPQKRYYRESYPQLKQDSFESTENILLDDSIESSESISLKDRFYCPYCGYLLRKPKKFCPKCGESLEDLSIT